MLEETFILSKIPLDFNVDHEVSIHVISPFIYILNVTDKKQLFLYIYNVRNSKKSTFDLIWHDPSLNADRTLVSSDGYLFVITENNDLHFYNIVEQEVFLERELLFTEFMDLLKYSGFPTNISAFKPLSLAGNNLVLSSINRWLIVMTWNYNPKVLKDFIVSCIDLGANTKSISSNRQFIFCLNLNGDILIHKAVDASFLVRISISDWLPWRDSYLAIDLNVGNELIGKNELVGLIDSDGSINILDISTAFSDGMNLNVDSCSSVSSEKSSKTTASSYSVTSRTSSASGLSTPSNVVSSSFKHYNAKYNVFNDSWNSYLQNLKKTATSGHSCSSSSKKSLNHVTKLNLSHGQGVIIKVHATDRGFSVISRLDSSVLVYRLFDKRSGHLSFEAELPNNCEVVLLSTIDVTLDLLVVENSLRLPLCSTPKHAFLDKLLQCVDESKITLLLEGWDELKSPVNLLLASIAEGQLDNVHLALNLHAQLFKLEAIGEDVGEGARTAEILNVLDAVVSSSYASEQFVRQIRGLELTHSYRLLSLLDELNIPILMKSEAAALRHKLMECIMGARAGLEESGRIGEGAVSWLPQNSVEWVLWEGMSDADVLSVGVDRLSAVHCFLAVRRNWTPQQLSGAHFKRLVLTCATHLALKQDLAAAQHLLAQSGYNATEELKEICLTTLNVSLREFLIEKVDDILTDDEEENYVFLSLVLDVLIRFNGTPEAEEEIPKNLSLTISNTKQLSEENRLIILTELFFTTWDPLLLDKLTCLTSWKYLIESNRLDLLELWVKGESSDLYPFWPGNKFQKWSITQEMVDLIPQANCVDSTKQIMLDWLSLNDMFTSECKENTQNVLQQLARVKLLGDYKRILDDELKRRLLQLACEKNMTDLVVIISDDFPQLISPHFPLAQRCEKHWFQLWEAFLEVDENWEQKNILELTRKSVDLIANGSIEAYLKNHPFISVAISILEDKSLRDVEDALSVSPLLAVGVQSQEEANIEKKTSLYTLLSGTSAFQTDLLFQWQPSLKRNSSSEGEQFPQFSCAQLSVRFGHKQNLQFLDHLQTGRPSFAFMQYFQENASAQGKISVRMQKRGANVAHGLALRCASERVRVRVRDGEAGQCEVACSACVAFTEMLSRSSLKLRVHLAAINVIRRRSTNNQQQTCITDEELSNTIEGLASINEPLFAGRMLKMLELVIGPRLGNLKGDDEAVVSCLREWHLPVRLALQHDLSLPETFPIQIAHDDKWLLFLMTMSIFGYSKLQTIELLKNFRRRSLREHLLYALQFDVDSEGHILKIDANTVIDADFKETESFFVHVAKHGASVSELLRCARSLQSPGLVLLSTCFESNDMMAAFCEWLVASLPSDCEISLPVIQLDWSASNVSDLLNLVVSLSFIYTLHRGFIIFLPDNPLYHLSQFLVNSIVHRDFEKCANDLEKLKESCLELSNHDDVSKRFECDRDWVSRTALRLCRTALIKCFPSYSQQHIFLQTLCKAELQESLSVVITEPDFPLLLALSEYMTQQGLTLDYADICVDSCTFQFDKQLAKLVASGKFSVAHSFASIAGLSHDSIVLVEWREKAKSPTTRTSDFCDGCDAAFLVANLAPKEAAAFYLELTESSDSLEERYQLLKYALKWAKRLPNNSECHKELEILLKLYNLYLEENFNLKLIFEDISFKPLKTLQSSIIEEDTLNWLRMNKPSQKLSKSKVRRLDELIGKLLDLGDVPTVRCLEALYGYKTKDSLIIEGCLHLAEGGSTPDSLPEVYADLLTNISTSHSVHGLRTSNYRHAKNMSLSTSCQSFEDHENLDEFFDLNGTIDCVYKLSEQVVHGSRLTQFIIASLRVAQNYHLTYKEVIELESPLALINQGCADLELARDILTLAALRSDETVMFLCSQLVACVRRGGGGGVGIELFGCSGAALSRVLQLADDKIALGKLLIKAAALAQLESSSNCEQQTVELLVLAHSCFTCACNMEGISVVLKMARQLVDALVSSGRWKLMVRLLTGIARYTEMRYIFQVLKENNQFECILSDILGKYSGLKSATLDFARGDKELFTLVALHFGMYADLANMFLESAAAALDDLRLSTDNRPMHSEHNEKCLKSAIAEYSNAAQHYIMGNQLRSATEAVSRAELVALQLTLLKDGQQQVMQHESNLLNLTGAQASSLVPCLCNYEDACVLARAYDVIIDWSEALYRNFILKGNQFYLSAWMKHHSLNSKIVQDVARRFQLDRNSTAAMEKNMKHFMQMVSLSDLKYRVCSQLGFKDILQNLLSGPDLPYLKDTVWRSGFKKQHL